MKAKTFLLGATLAIIALLGGIYTGVQRPNLQPETSPSLPEGSIERLFASTLIDTTGKSQPFAQWQGKTLVVNFWATWCPPCREEMPAFSRLQTKYAANGVQFVGIAIDSADMVREFSLQYPTTYPLLIGGAEGVELTRNLGNPRLALPYTLIVSATGRPSFARLGTLSEHELDTLLQQSTTR
jgi:thiol-disulfide isomerase/thioredoxin